MAGSVVQNNLLEAIGIKVKDNKKSPGNEDYILQYKEKYPQNGSSLSKDFVKYFIPDTTFFQKKKQSGKDDWLATQRESGQTFYQWFQRNSAVPSRRRTTIYLLPLVFVEDPIPDEILQPLQTFAETFFQIPVKLMNVTDMGKKIPNRINNYSNTYQVDASKTLDAMKPLIPSDAFCVAGITLCDLYPRESWNFVFGLANLAGKCGVYSLARYLSNFGKSQTTVYDPESEEGGKSTIIKRACKTMCHEIGHMFGLKHCVFFECLMNGSNHLEESDGRPLFLCPVCLRKLQFACQFDIEARYQEMIPFWESHGLKTEVDWLQARLKKLKS